jgi:hypothetical protein
LQFVAVTGGPTMHRLSIFALAVVFPSSLLLLYLFLHVTEGWQLLVVALLGGGFVTSWVRRSKAALTASYAFTLALSSWVAWVNL